MDIDMLHKYTHMRVDAPSYFINCGNLNYLHDQLIIIKLCLKLIIIIKKLIKLITNLLELKHKK